MNGVDKTRFIDLNGKFEYTFSKNIDMKVIKPNIIGYKYNVLTQYIDSIRVTPMQTIIKIKSKYTGIKRHTLSTSGNEWNDPELIGNPNFNTYDENMNKISRLKVQAKREAIFEDGHTEIWNERQGGPDFGQTDVVGQNMEIIDYIIVSNTDYNEKLYIYPTKEQEVDGGGNCYDVEMGKGYIIDFEKIKERNMEDVEEFENIGTDITEEEIISTTLTGVIEKVVEQNDTYVKLNMKEILENGEFLVYRYKIYVDEETKILRNGEDIKSLPKVEEKQELPIFEVGQKIRVTINYKKEELYVGFVVMPNTIEFVE